MDGWLDVAAAARLLGVSPRQVRNLIEHDELPAQRMGGNWLLAADAVRSRAARSPSAGRPVGPELAWHLLAVVQHQLDDAVDHGAAVVESMVDRRQRHRLRQMLVAPHPASVWLRRVARRADRQRYWVHPGLVDRLGRDARLHVGGSVAAAAAGVGIVAGAPDRFYVDADELVAVTSSYHLRADASGLLDVMVVPPGALRDLIDGAGPVPLAVALADLLESDDARERHEAAVRFERVMLPPVS